MHHFDEFLQTEVTISGSSADALCILNGHPFAQRLQKAVKLQAKVRHPSRNRIEYYQFPIIVNGDAEKAKQSLENLRKQKAITEKEYSLLDNVIQIAKNSSI